MPALLNLACETVASAPGTGTTIPLSGAALAGGFLTWLAAGAQNGAIYRLEILDGNNREIATAAYNAATNSFVNRTTLLASVTGTKQTTPINASANAVIAAVAAAEDLQGSIVTHAFCGGVI